LLRGVSKDVIADGDAGPNKQFNLVQITPLPAPPTADFGIMPGHVFVDGIQAILNGWKTLSLFLQPPPQMLDSGRSRNGSSMAFLTRKVST